MAQAVATELIERDGGRSIVRTDDPFLPISVGLPEICRLGEQLAESVRTSPPTSGQGARKAIDDALRLSFDFTEDPLDFGSELVEVQPSIDWTVDKYPQWLPFQSVQGKCEVGVALARTGAGNRSTYELSYAPSGHIIVSFSREDGSRTDSTRLEHVTQLGPGQPDFAGRIMAVNEKALKHVTEATERAMKGHQVPPTDQPPGFPLMPGNRFYAAGTARWLTQVRMEQYLGGEHPYAYAENNPVTYSDPSGLQAGIDPWQQYQQGWNRCIQNDIDTVNNTLQQIPLHFQNPEWNQPFRGPLYPVYGHFCGPQTIDGEKIGDGKPINAVDACCQTHDHCFARHHCNAGNQWTSIACRNCTHALCECFKHASCGLDIWCIAAREGFMIYACSGAAGWGPV